MRSLVSTAKTALLCQTRLTENSLLIKRSPEVKSRVGIRLGKWVAMDNSFLMAKPGEAAFAASGTCLITHGTNNLFLVTGGNDARVFRSNDRGLTWSVAETPIIKGASGSGIFSIAMFDDQERHYCWRRLRKTKRSER